MNLFLSIVGVIAFLFSLFAILVGKSAINDILAAIYLLVAIVSFIGIAICNKLDSIGKLLTPQREPKSRPAESDKALIVG